MEPNTKRPDRQEIARLKDTTIKCLTQHKICTGVVFFFRDFSLLKDDHEYLIIYGLCTLHIAFNQLQVYWTPSQTHHTQDLIYGGGKLTELSQTDRILMNLFTIFPRMYTVVLRGHCADWFATQ